MFLTRMSLNPARKGTRLLVSSPQRMHAAVLSGFAPGQATESKEGRVLWRIDRIDPTATLYVSSPERPDLTHLIEQAGWPTSGEAWHSSDMSAFLRGLDTGQRWVFRITANPVKARRSPDEGRSRVQGQRSAADQTEWFMRQSGRHGFVIPDNRHAEPQLTLRDRRTPSFDRRGDERRDRVTLVTATYDGVLEVADPDLLRSALGHGIGRAKGYGCGLLTLARL